jgi:transcriptional regulator of acetoin/glycerol metabolism
MALSESFVETAEHRLAEARARFFDRGETPEDLLSPTVFRSWKRSRDHGLEAAAQSAGESIMSGPQLNAARERNGCFLAYSESIMQQIHAEVREHGSIVVLSDPNGLILRSVGDADFLARAERVALMPGACWDETFRGTNAIGTAIVEAAPVEVVGAEHFLEHNTFLTCSASPILDPQGNVRGVLNISGDRRGYQSHTLCLVRMATQVVEKQLFEAEHANAMLISLHPRAEFLGSLAEGLLAISPDGAIQAINRPGQALLGLASQAGTALRYAGLFDLPLGSLIDRLRHDRLAHCPITSRQGQRFFARLRGNVPMLHIPRRPAASPAPAAAPDMISSAATRKPSVTLDNLGTGDPRLQAAIDKARRILGRDIPMLIQGESGAGKEMFAAAFHNSGPHADGPFVALNCASIPETLIESQLFGYQGGAFTGARKEGAVGVIQQANGGTLFLDEIGDMPLHLQARLLRVLQDHSVTPLGGGKAINVNFSLICATHRRLKEEVARSNFREDLYYRLNGLLLTMPALRERTDLAQLIRQIATAETGDLRSVEISEAAMAALLCYSWPGNIRELKNVIRVAIAILEDGESVICERHLPEDLLEAVHLQQPASPPAAAHSAFPSGDATRLADIEKQAVQKVLDAVGGNISKASRQLGISRNTLYRKIGRLS